jgi:hypothetical protein
MKKSLPAIAILLLAVSAFAADDEFSAAKTRPTPEQAEVKYTEVIDQRAQKIVDALGLSDTNAAAKVHDIIVAQYRDLNDWHNANDSEVKAAKGDPAAIAKIKVPLRELHDEYLSKLGQYLTPAQIETVKDKMTYGKVQFTFAGYCAEYSNLSETNKQEILKFLKEAREEAMDAGSSNEKSAIFNHYKGKINNYLSKQGIHPDKSRPHSKAAGSTK